jgi:FkbM family methyltransferase
MIEHNGVLIHLDPKSDRVVGSELEFDGWVVTEADRSLKGIWLPAVGMERLTICDRPDVRRVFPNRTALGFSGKCPERSIGPGGLRLALQVTNEVIEVEYPLPEPLPKLRIPKRIGSAGALLWLSLRERLTTNPAKRWRLRLRRHLIYRRQRSGIFRRLHTEALLNDFATAVPDAFFIQIGANDGFTGDPLHQLINRADTRWRGVLVEPVAHLFAELSKRYADNSALQLERAAICESDGTAIIHRLETKTDDSLWLDQVPSFDLDLVRRTAQQLGVTDKATVGETVPCLSVATLLERHRIKRIDLLVIDAEGWDWRILRQFDLSRLRPKLILYEHQHLSPEECAQAHQFLRRHKYEWEETPEGDTLAWTIN